MPKSPHGLHCSEPDRKTLEEWVDVVDYDFNWKTFIEVYLEDYHVAPYHPGLGHFVTCDDLKWEYGDWWSVQTVGINNQLARPGSAVYARWHEQVLKFGKASRRPTAPSGSPTTRTSWSSGTRTSS